MVFPYYYDLSKKNQAIYDQSDAAPSASFSGVREIYPLVTNLQKDLASGVRKDTEKSTRALVWALCRKLEVPKVAVSVLSHRPSDDYGELHGLYVRDSESRSWPRLTVWMRTAKHKRIVAPKTFIRTVLHELLHHLDYEYYELEDSFHTEGFFKREAALFHRIKAGLK